MNKMPNVIDYNHYYNFENKRFLELRCQIPRFTDEKTGSERSGGLPGAKQLYQSPGQRALLLRCGVPLPPECSDRAAVPRTARPPPSGPTGTFGLAPLSGLGQPLEPTSQEPMAPHHP